MEFLRDNAPDSLDPAEGNFGTRAYDAWKKHKGGVPVDMASATESITLAGAKCGEKSGGCAVSTDRPVPLDSGPVGYGLVFVALAVAARRRRR